MSVDGDTPETAGTPETVGKRWVVDALDANFELQAIERSRVTPVVVDFWAPWCAPCRMLGPVLERLADEYDGRFMLVKVNTEQAPYVASQFGVQSIPMVFALRDGQLVDQFQGALPEAEIRRWLDAWLPSEADEQTADGLHQLAADPAAAETAFRRALTANPKHWPAKIGLARSLLAQGKTSDCRSVVDELSARGFMESETDSLVAELKLREAASSAGDVDECRRLAEASPDDLSLQWALAQAAAASGDHPLAFETCLRLVQLDKTGLGQPAKELMVNLFQALGHGSDLVNQYRRKLSSALY